MNYQRSFLKWAGGKYNCLNHVLASLPPAKRLIEPFVGSGTVFINTHYESYLLGEQNKDLIHLFTKLQEFGDTFIDYCRQFFSPEYNTEEKYYQFREEFNQSRNLKKRFALFLYLNKHGFNGLCRYNSSGKFNVPFGSYETITFPQKTMEFFHQKSQQATFVHGDFRTTFKKAKIGDIIYCDPPYVPLSSQPINYSGQIFKEADQIDLARLAEKTAAKGIPVIISNHDTDFTRLQYKQASITSFPVSRWINCLAKGRVPVKELIAVFNSPRTLK